MKRRFLDYFKIHKQDEKRLILRNHDLNTDDSDTLIFYRIFRSSMTHRSKTAQVDGGKWKNWKTRRTSISKTIHIPSEDGLETRKPDTDAKDWENESIKLIVRLSSGLQIKIFQLIKLRAIIVIRLKWQGRRNIQGGKSKTSRQMEILTDCFISQKVKSKNLDFDICWIMKVKGNVNIGIYWTFGTKNNDRDLECANSVQSEMEGRNSMREIHERISHREIRPWRIEHWLACQG